MVLEAGMKDGDCLGGCCLLTAKESNVTELPVVPPLDLTALSALLLLLLPNADAEPVAMVLKLGGEPCPVV